MEEVIKDQDPRTSRQKGMVKLWFNTGRNGTFQTVTGFGKTKLATDILAEPDYNPESVLVVVPTIYLKGQWTEMIEEADGINSDIEVIVINTAIKSKWNVDLLIMDRQLSI
jgi:superfamily II DNA or RNA helicase